MTGERSGRGFLGLEGTGVPMVGRGFQWWDEGSRRRQKNKDDDGGGSAGRAAEQAGASGRDEGRRWNVCSASAELGSASASGLGYCAWVWDLGRCSGAEEEEGESNSGVTSERGRQCKLPTIQKQIFNSA